MKPVDPSSHIAAVLRLRLVESMSVRRIAFHLPISCKTVREILGPRAPAKQPMLRGPFLDPYVEYSDTIPDVCRVGTK
jgi:hypothetical protein